MSVCHCDFVDLFLCVFDFVVIGSLRICVVVLVCLRVFVHWCLCAVVPSRLCAVVPSCLVVFVTFCHCAFVSCLFALCL